MLSLSEREKMEREKVRLEPPRLVRFHGRPQELTPKATILQALGRVYPSKFGSVMFPRLSNTRSFFFLEKPENSTIGTSVPFFTFISYPFFPCKQKKS